ncbi:hypothetical protein [Mycobacterium sp.]|jgi:hypothetical protein|uniref:hypothetical protein n=1 Tax=Mycobacterium sp. TaxID=1785 RepID=UPI002623A966|nr:hypothetical protein [Mycobacterium sp.]
MNRTTDVLQIAVPFAWFGLVLGISVLETPLKFRAPGMTLALGLGVGRLVFRALNAAELVLAAVLTASLVGAAPGVYTTILVAIIWLLLLVQVFGLRPALDRRVQVILDGGTPPRSRLHRLYIALEGIKLLALPTLGTILALSSQS